MIVNRLSWFLGTLFLMACFGALMNPPPYLIMATLFLLMGLILLPPTSKITQQRFNWKINGGTKVGVLIVGFILIYLFVPQVEPKPSPFSNRPQQRIERFN